MRLRVNRRLAPHVSTLLADGRLVLDDGKLSRDIARALAPMRRNNGLLVGFDRRMGKSILLVNGYQLKSSRNVPFGTIVFDLDNIF